MATQPAKRGKPKGGLKRGPKAGRAGTYLGGQLLIAMPTMQDPRFARSVVYMCTHTKDGAMGLIINQRADNISFPELLVQARIVQEGKERAVPAAVRAMHVHVGGPVEMGRGFVLHSADFKGNDSTVTIDDTISLTATIDILRAIARGKGPVRSLLALGCAGWSSGQLEREMGANGWLHCQADPDLVFDTALDRKYERALATLGVNPSHLVSQAGHA
jgi:putative transcriptional regulator